jgi:hypothetical protein
VEDSFFLTFANDGQQQPNSTRIQGRNLLLNGCTTTVGKWYRLEYSRYTNSTVHVLVHKISEANPREIPLQVRVKDGLIQVWLNINMFENFGPTNFAPLNGFLSKNDKFNENILISTYCSLVFI